MRRLTSIVAVNKQGVIGVGNSLPWRIRSDMLFFKQQTSGNIVIMGRKTHDSLGKCLPNRHNIVVSHQLALFESTQDCVLRYGIADALTAAESAPKQFSETFVIGGAMMYEQFANLVDRYLVTVIDKAVPDGDAFFDERIVGNDADWEMKEIEAGVADGNGNEASYQIFELTSRHLEERQQRRAALVADWKNRAKAGPKRTNVRSTAAFDLQRPLFA